MVQTVGYLYGAVFPAVGDVALGVDYGIEGDSLTGTLNAGTEPDPPTFTTATGANSVTLTIDGDAGVTNYVVYKASSDTAWLAGGNRSGDGDVTVSSLDNDVPYIFTVYSVDGAGLSSTPGVAVNITLSEDSTNEIDADLDYMAIEQLDSFAEPVTYWPRGGGSRSINAIVDREPSEKLEGMPHGYSPRLVLWVANDSTIGISSSEIDTGGDLIELPMRIGQVAEKFSMVKIGSQDVGMIMLGIANG